MNCRNQVTILSKNLNFRLEKFFQLSLENDLVINFNSVIEDHLRDVIRDHLRRRLDFSLCNIRLVYAELKRATLQTTWLRP